MVCGFISEALAGRCTAVHTIYYEVDDEDGLVAIPGKYADRGETAEYLRQMAHAVNGRFHWFRSGGDDSLYNVLDSIQFPIILYNMPVTSLPLWSSTVSSGGP